METLFVVVVVVDNDVGDPIDVVITVDFVVVVFKFTFNVWSVGIKNWEFCRRISGFIGVFDSNNDDDGGDDITYDCEIAEE